MHKTAADLAQAKPPIGLPPRVTPAPAYKPYEAEQGLQATPGQLVQHHSDYQLSLGDYGQELRTQRQKGLDTVQEMQAANQQLQQRLRQPGANPAGIQRQMAVNSALIQKWNQYHQSLNTAENTRSRYSDEHYKQRVPQDILEKVKLVHPNLPAWNPNAKPRPQVAAPQQPAPQVAQPNIQPQMQPKQPAPQIAPKPAPIPSTPSFKPNAPGVRGAASPTNGLPGLPKMAFQTITVNIDGKPYTFNSYEEANKAVEAHMKSKLPPPDKGPFIGNSPMTLPVSSAIGGAAGALTAPKGNRLEGTSRGMITGLASGLGVMGGAHASDLVAKDWSSTPRAIANVAGGLTAGLSADLLADKYLLGPASWEKKKKEQAIKQSDFWDSPILADDSLVRTARATTIGSGFGGAFAPSGHTLEGAGYGAARGAGAGIGYSTGLGLMRAIAGHVPSQERSLSNTIAELGAGGVGAIGGMLGADKLLGRPKYMEDKATRDSTKPKKTVKKSGFLGDALAANQLGLSRAVAHTHQFSPAEAIISNKLEHKLGKGPGLLVSNAIAKRRKALAGIDDEEDDRILEETADLRERRMQKSNSGNRTIKNADSIIARLINSANKPKWYSDNDSKIDDMFHETDNNPAAGKGFPWKKKKEKRSHILKLANMFCETGTDGMTAGIAMGKPDLNPSATGERKNKINITNTTFGDSALKSLPQRTMQKISAIREISPFCAAFLEACAHRGYSETEITKAIVKSAALYPEVKKDWESVFEKMAAGGFRIPSIRVPVPKVHVPHIPGAAGAVEALSRAGNAVAVGAEHLGGAMDQVRGLKPGDMITLPLEGKTYQFANEGAAGIRVTEVDAAGKVPPGAASSHIAFDNAGKPQTVPPTAQAAVPPTAQAVEAPPTAKLAPDAPVAQAAPAAAAADVAARRALGGIAEKGGWKTYNNSAELKQILQDPLAAGLKDGQHAVVMGQRAIWQAGEGNTGKFIISEKTPQAGGTGYKQLEWDATTNKPVYSDAQPGHDFVQSGFFNRLFGNNTTSPAYYLRRPSAGKLLGSGIVGTGAMIGIPAWQMAREGKEPELAPDAAASQYLTEMHQTLAKNPAAALEEAKKLFAANPGMQHTMDKLNTPELWAQAHAAAKTPEQMAALWEPLKAGMTQALHNDMLARGGKVKGENISAMPWNSKAPLPPQGKLAPEKATANSNSGNTNGTPPPPPPDPTANKGLGDIGGLWGALPSAHKWMVGLGAPAAGIGLINSMTPDDEENPRKRRNPWLAPALGLGGAAALGYGITRGQPSKLLSGDFWTGGGKTGAHILKHAFIGMPGLPALAAVHGQLPDPNAPKPPPVTPPAPGPAPIPGQPPAPIPSPIPGQPPAAPPVAPKAQQASGLAGTIQKGLTAFNKATNIPANLANPPAVSMPPNLATSSPQQLGATAMSTLPALSAPRGAPPPPKPPLSPTAVGGLLGGGTAGNPLGTAVSAIGAASGKATPPQPPSAQGAASLVGNALGGNQLGAAANAINPQVEAATKAVLADPGKTQQTLQDHLLKFPEAQTPGFMENAMQWFSSLEPMQKFMFIASIVAAGAGAVNMMSGGSGGMSALLGMGGLAGAAYSSGLIPGFGYNQKTFGEPALAKAPNSDLSMLNPKIDPSKMTPEQQQAHEALWSSPRLNRVKAIQSAMSMDDPAWENHKAQMMKRYGASAGQTLDRLRAEGNAYGTDNTAENESDLIDLAGKAAGRIGKDPNAVHNLGVALRNVPHMSQDGITSMLATTLPQLEQSSPPIAKLLNTHLSALVGGGPGALKAASELEGMMKQLTGDQGYKLNLTSGQMDKMINAIKPVMQGDPAARSAVGQAAWQRLQGTAPAAYEAKAKAYGYPSYEEMMKAYKANPKQVLPDELDWSQRNPNEAGTQQATVPALPQPADLKDNQFNPISHPGIMSALINPQMNHEVAGEIASRLDPAVQERVAQSLATNLYNPESTRSFGGLAVPQLALARRNAGLLMNKLFEQAKHGQMPQGGNQPSYLNYGVGMPTSEHEAINRAVGSHKLEEVLKQPVNSKGHPLAELIKSPINRPVLDRALLKLTEGDITSPITRNAIALQEHLRGGTSAQNPDTKNLGFNTAGQQIMHKAYEPVLENLRRGYSYDQQKRPVPYDAKNYEQLQEKMKGLGYNEYGLPITQNAMKDFESQLGKTDYQHPELGTYSGRAYLPSAFWGHMRNEASPEQWSRWATPGFEPAVLENKLKGHDYDEATYGHKDQAMPLDGRRLRDDMLIDPAKNMAAYQRYNQIADVADKVAPGVANKWHADPSAKDFGDYFMQHRAPRSDPDSLPNVIPRDQESLARLAASVLGGNAPNQLEFGGKPFKAYGRPSDTGPSVDLRHRYWGQDKLPDDRSAILRQLEQIVPDPAERDKIIRYLDKHIPGPKNR